MKVTEKQIRRIIRQALCELGGGNMDEIEQDLLKFNAELIRFYCEFDEQGMPTTLCVRTPYDQFTGPLDGYMSEKFGLSRNGVAARGGYQKIVWYQKRDFQKPINERVEEWDQQLQILNTELRKFDAGIDQNASQYNPKYGIKRLVVLVRKCERASEQEMVEKSINGLMYRSGYEPDPRVQGGRPGYKALGYRIVDVNRKSWKMQAKNVSGGGYGGYGGGNIDESADRIVKQVLREFTEPYASQNKEEINQFISGCENGRGFADEGMAYVQYEGDENRYIVYEFNNPNYLRDDNYSVQHIPLGDRKLEVRNAIENNLGVRLPDDFSDYENTEDEF